MYRKFLICTIITLFIGASSVPVICGNVEQSSYDPISLSLTDGLVGFWTFDEGDGSIAYDYSGNGKDGTLYGAMWVDGISGKALDFDGNDDYVGTSLTQSLSSNAFSVFLWAKDIPNGNKYIVSQAHIFSPFTSDWLLGNPNHGLWFNDEKIDGNNQLSDGNWHHIGLIFDGIAAKLYIDGTQHNSSIIPPEVGGVGPVVFMARADATKGFVSGTIDEARIYNRMLNENETQELYNNPGGVPDKPTIIGPRTGKPKQEYDYSFSSVDPDDDTIYYYIDWGDDQVDEWIGPFPSGFEVKIGHTWEEKGTYIISAKSKDNAGKESDWTTFAISMPKNKAINTPLFSFPKNHPYMFPLLRQLLGLQ